MANCLTDGAVYGTHVMPRKAICVVDMPNHIDLVENDEIIERIHRGMEWALAPYFVGKFVNDR